METISSEIQRIFLGDQSSLFLLEVVFRTFVMFAYTLFAVRFIGKRGMQQITPFEFVIIIALGSAVGDPMFYDDVPLLHGMAVITVVVLMQKILNNITNASPKIEQVVESKVAQIVRNGEVIPGSLENEGISEQELHMYLRTQGIKNMGEVECAYLEPSGNMSVFRFSEGKTKVGVSILP
jgi:uncharacterized membrane protein YcaP (DUF421 family)